MTNQNKAFLDDSLLVEYLLHLLAGSLHGLVRLHSSRNGGQFLLLLTLPHLRVHTVDEALHIHHLKTLASIQMNTTDKHPDICILFLWTFKRVEPCCWARLGRFGLQFFSGWSSGAEGIWWVSGVVWLACPSASDGYTVYSFLPTVKMRNSMITS